MVLTTLTFILLGFGSSSVDTQFSVWAKKENFLLLKNEIYQQIKAAFDSNGVEIPFPHVSLYSGEASKPIPVSFVDIQSDNAASSEKVLDKDKN